MKDAFLRFQPRLVLVHTAAFSPQSQRFCESDFQGELIRQQNRWNFFFLLRHDRRRVSIKKKTPVTSKLLCDQSFKNLNIHDNTVSVNKPLMLCFW